MFQRILIRQCNTLESYFEIKSEEYWNIVKKFHKSEFNAFVRYFFLFLLFLLFHIFFSFVYFLDEQILKIEDNSKPISFMKNNPRDKPNHYLSTFPIFQSTIGESTLFFFFISSSTKYSFHFPHPFIVIHCSILHANFIQTNPFFYYFLNKFFK